MSLTLAEYAGLSSATVIFVWSPLFARVRSLAPSLLACAMCVGFWVGIGGGILPEGLRRGLDVFLDGCLVGVLAWLIYLVGRCLDDL